MSSRKYFDQPNSGGSRMALCPPDFVLHLYIPSVRDLRLQALRKNAFIDQMFNEKLISLVMEMKRCVTVPSITMVLAGIIDALVSGESKSPPS